jgi:predicted transcriptional regulator of viral defense system
MPGDWRIGSEGPNQFARVRVSRLAARQFGRIAWRQLSALGVGKATISEWTATAYLHRVLPGVYGVGHLAASFEADLAAALLYAGPGAALSHATATWWLKLSERRPITIDVTRRRGAWPH